MTNNQPTDVAPVERKLAGQIGMRTLQLLERSNMLNDSASGDVPTIYAWPFPERVALIIDPMRVRNINTVLSPRFQHHLATALAGRRVVMTNHRGIILQVGYWPEPARELVAKPLDLAQQPSPLHVPIGATARRDLWLPIDQLDAVLIGGSRRMGKSTLLHAWIAALLNGGATRLVLFDGKAGMEFGRYREQPRVTVIDGKLGPALTELLQEMNRRIDLLRTASVVNLADYNASLRGDGDAHHERLERIVLVIDELAFALQELGVEGVLVDLAARGGAVGIHPVVATNQCRAEVVTANLKVNLPTRIALAVPSQSDSRVILDASDAARLPNVRGRLLIKWNARLIQAQAFRVDLPAVGAGNQLPQPAQLSARERQIAIVALTNGGEFKIRDIARAVGEDPSVVIKLARGWEAKGLLTPVQRSKNGNGGRRVTDALIALVQSFDRAQDAERGECGNMAKVAESG